MFDVFQSYHWRFLYYVCLLTRPILHASAFYLEKSEFDQDWKVESWPPCVCVCVCV